MLVLSRQRDESIYVGDDIKITVTDIRGDKVRLGIDAPREVTVHRQEIYEDIQRDFQRANVDDIFSSCKQGYEDFLGQLDKLTRLNLIEKLDDLNQRAVGIRSRYEGTRNLESLCNKVRKMETNAIKEQARVIGREFAKVA